MNPLRGRGFMCARSSPQSGAPWRLGPDWDRQSDPATAQLWQASQPAAAMRATLPDLGRQPIGGRLGVQVPDPLRGDEPRDLWMGSHGVLRALVAGVSAVAIWYLHRARQAIQIHEGDGRSAGSQRHERPAGRRLDRIPAYVST